MPEMIEIDKSMNYRAVALVKSKEQDGAPVTWDEASRSLEMVAATENPVDEIDWDRYEIVPTVLRMDGCLLPANGQLPLLDTHRRHDTSTVIGSYRDLRIEGQQMLGRAHFSSAKEAAGPALKVSEGHITDCSIARKDIESTYIPAGQTGIVGGRSYSGPIRVVTKWKPTELSICPIGADEMAKARAATQPINPQREERTMPDKNKTGEESGRGNQDTTVQPINPDPVRALTEADVERKAGEMTRAEINRREEIRSMCDFYGFGELARELVDGNKSVDEARAAIMAKQMKDAPAPAARLTLVADERDKFRSAAEGALILRCGLRHDPAKLAVGATDLRGYSLREMARECLRMAGQPHGGDAMTMIGRALTTSDFPILLGNTANLSLMAGWEMAEESWEKWADGSGSVSDFKTHTMARAGETDDLDEIGEDDEYKYGAGGEQSEQFSIATYGKLNKISRQAIINDDLGAISDAFARRGEAAARKVGDIVYAVLVANSAMGDGTALFHTDHGNLGSAGAISEVTMAEIIKLMGLQTDVRGIRRLNISPRYILAPKTAEGYAEIFFSSLMFANDLKSATRANPYAGPKFERVYEARLDDASTTAWYAAAAKGKTIKVFFLNGNRTPYLETRDGWTVDGVEFKTRIDAGAKAVDWRGLAKNAGG